MPSKSIESIQSLVGDSVSTVEDLTVEAGKVTEFATALRDDRPLFRDEEVATDRGYRAIPAPLTFSRVGYFPRYRPPDIDRNLGFDLGFDPASVLQGSQSYRYDRPLYVGETVHGSTTLEKAYQRDGSGGSTLTFAVLRTDFRTTAGEQVLSATITRIEVEEDETAATDGGTDDRYPLYAPPVPENADGDTAPTSRGDPRDPRTDGGSDPRPVDLDVGDSGPTLTVTDVDRRDFVKYAGASGDFNRVHYDEPYARQSGYDSVFGQGMLTAGYATRFVTEWFEVASIREFSTRFESRLLPGDSLVISGTVTDVSGESGPTITADIDVTNQDDDTILTGTVTASPGDEIQG